MLNSKNITFIVCLVISNWSVAQVKIGIWEKYDTSKITPSAFLKNTKKWLNKFKQVLSRNFKINPQILFVVAAGNSGKDVIKSMDVPGNITLPNVIVVGSYDQEKKQQVSFSSFGENVDIYAPSVEIEYKGAFGYVHYGDGSSFAVPYVTAVCAKRKVKL